MRFSRFTELSAGTIYDGSRTRGYNKMHERITDNPRTVVTYEDGRLSNSFQGPVKGLYRELNQKLGQRGRLVD
ncbi:hypothetical protein G9A89_013734 [Geosiphon pyriformis]|nr:hypothetical protein G9A89_013734 [Geosiphon pyriformis]